MSTTFLQIPVKIKDEALEYINRLCLEHGNLGVEAKESSPWAEQGCFFVISLEKIEEMIHGLEAILSLEDSEVEIMRAEVRKVINMLHGQ